MNDTTEGENSEDSGEVYNFKVTPNQPSATGEDESAAAEALQIETIGAAVVGLVLICVVFIIMWKVVQRKKRQMEDQLQKAILSSDEEESEIGSCHQQHSTPIPPIFDQPTLPHSIPDQVHSRHSNGASRAVNNEKQRGSGNRAQAAPAIEMKDEKKKTNKSDGGRWAYRRRNRVDDVDNFDDVITSDKSHELICTLKSQRVDLDHKMRKAADVCLKAFKMLRDCSKMFLGIRQTLEVSCPRSIDPMMRQNLAEIRQRCRQQRLASTRMDMFRRFEKNEQRQKKEAYMTMHSWLNKFQLRPDLRQAVEETCLLQSDHRHQEIRHFRQKAIIKRSIHQLESARKNVRKIKLIARNAIDNFEIVPTGGNRWQREDTDYDPATLEFDDLYYSAAFKEIDHRQHLMHKKNETMIRDQRENQQHHSLVCKNCKNENCTCPKRPLQNRQAAGGSENQQHTVALRLAETACDDEAGDDGSGDCLELTEREVHKVLKQVSAVKSVISVARRSDKEWNVVVISTRPRIGLVRFSCRGKSYAIELLNENHHKV